MMAKQTLGMTLIRVRLQTDLGRHLINLGVAVDRNLETLY